MRKTVPLGLTLLLILTLILSSCGNADKASPDPAATNSGEQHKTAEDSATKEPATKETTAGENSAEEVITEETTTEEETTKAPENFLEALFDISPEKGALAEVLTKKVDEYGKPWFTNENISKVKGIGLTYIIDLDDDGTDELILVHWEDTEPYGGYVMEIYGGRELTLSIPEHTTVWELTMWDCGS